MEARLCSCRMGGGIQTPAFARVYQRRDCRGWLCGEVGVEARREFRPVPRPASLPIFDSIGRPIAVSGRYFEKVPGQKEEGEPAKYVKQPGDRAVLKNLKHCTALTARATPSRKADCILLVEGQFDLVLCHQSGLPFTVALSGTALTPEHLSLLGRLSKRLVLALDADSAGIRAGLRSAQMALRGRI